MTSVNHGSKESAVLEEYILKIAKEDQSAFEELYLKTKTPVYGFALSVLKNTHDAEDVLQETFVSIHHGAKSYAPSGKPMAWIMTIAKNHCMRKFREYRSRSDLPEEDWERYLESADRVTPEDKMVIEQVMNGLSDEERQIVVLRYFRDMTQQQIADRLQISQVQVSRLEKKILASLREALE